MSDRLGDRRRDRRAVARGATSATRRRRGARWRASPSATRRSMPSRPSRAERALAKRARRSMRHARSGKPLGPLAGVPFAVKNLFDVAGLPTLAGSKINRDHAPADARRDADRAAGGGRRRAGRRAQHGRIRLRLHRRERPRRPLAQSARHDAHDRRLVRRLGRRGRRRAGAALARLRHQRLDPRAVVVLRPVRAEADLRPAVARAHVSRSSPASIISGRWRARRATSRSPTTPCRATIPTIRSAPTRPVEPAAAAARTRHRRACASRSPAAISARARCPKRSTAVERVAKALGVDARDRDSRRPRARAPPPTSSPRPKARRCISTACARAPRDFDPAVRDRLIAGAMVPAALVVKAQKFRRWYRDAGAASCSTSVDAILAPATPCTAPPIGQQTFMLDGVEMPLRANIGIFTQPISFIGLPVVAVPVPLDAAADRRADHRRALARGRRAAHRPCAGAEPASPPRRGRLAIGSDSDGDRPAGGGRRGAARRSSATRRRWSSTTSRRSTRCSATTRAPSATASARTSTATTRSRRSAPPARRSA